MLVGELVHVATLTRAHRTNSRAATTGPTSSIVTKRLSVGNDDLGNAGLVRRKPGIDTVNIVDDLAAGLPRHAWHGSPPGPGSRTSAAR
jgi:hypothetical protein